MSGSGVPRVSVIIPTFNRAGYLDEAIASAASQDFDALEVVIADNASSDDTPAVARRAVAHYGHDRVKYVRRSENVGWQANFNLALAEVRGDAALVLGDDDRLLPGAIRRGVEALDRAPSAGIVHAAFESIDADGSRIETATDWTAGLVGDTLEPGQVFILRSMPWPTRVFAHSALIRRTAFQEPMWDPADGLVSDCILWLRIALDWDVQFLATPAAERRVHRGSLSMGFGQIVGVDYVFDPTSVLALRAAKLRFISRFARRLDDVDRLRRIAYRGSRRELAAFSRAMTGGSRRDGARAVWEAIRAQPTVVFEPWTWRAATKVALGTRLSARFAHHANAQAAPPS